MSNRFVKEINNSKLFVGDEMDEELRKIILDNQNLIYSIIHRFKGNNYEDLFQAGCLGIINAYKRFNNNLNIKFTTYAYPYIVGEIYRCLIDNRNIHMSPVNIKLLKSMNKAEEYLTNYLGRSPSDSEIADFLEIDLYKLFELKNMVRIDSLDYEYNNNDLYDFTFQESVAKEDLIDLRNALSSLNPIEKKLIKDRYFNDITQANLAKMYNTNQVKISREEKKVLCKLKAKMY